MNTSEINLRALLDAAEMRTPGPVLDAGFTAAMLNFDALYMPPAWLEGISGWACYFSNNYQISAAIALGQLDRAREALLFFGERQDGFGGIYGADGSCGGYHSTDGLPYYLLQLYRCWTATGDTATLRRVWISTRRALEAFLREHDPQDSGLLNWHTGCNAFLYQADHLSLPGAGLSPTLMAAGVLQRLSQMAEALGEELQASEWRRISARMRNQALSVLWMEDNGRFCSCQDPLGGRHEAAYCTDYVYPALYVDLPTEIQRRCLESLDRGLWVSECLMRTGSYLPDLFGNNGVHPVGMCEAAEGYAAHGRAERAWALLHGTAAGAVVRTDSPGAFAEFASLRGQGTLNIPFGNCAGAFLQATVGGLFGYEPVAAPGAVRWHPAIPAQWASSLLRVREAVLETRGRAQDRVYRLTLPMAQALDLTVPSFGGRAEAAADAAGSAVDYRTCENGCIAMASPASRVHEIRIRLSGLSDSPQKIQASPPPAKPQPAYVQGPRAPVDLSPYFREESLPAINLWGHAAWLPGSELTFDLRDLLEVGPEPALKVGPCLFHVRPSGRNLVLLSAGRFDDQSVFRKFGGPSSLRIPVGRAIRGAEWLLASEPKVRTTGMEIGAAVFHLAQGIQRMPLVVGRQTDSAIGPYATETFTQPLPIVHRGVRRYVAAWCAGLDGPAQVVQEIDFCVERPDLHVAILAVNLIVTTA